MAQLRQKKTIILFFSTFVSAFLLVFGIITLVLLFMPVLTPDTEAQTPYHPQLPLSANREEAFLDISKETAKQLYPELTTVEPVSTGDWIRIPSLHLNVPLVASPSLEDKDVLASLSAGAALYPNGILPGRLGNVFIAAHSTAEPWKGAYRFAFLKINELKLGNIIHLDYHGTRYTYRVVDSQLIKPKPDFTVASNRPVPTVTLMACWPLWTANQRMLVTGELTNITKLTPTPQ